jgi:hypothetical protein
MLSNAQKSAGTQAPISVAVTTAPARSTWVAHLRVASMQTHKEFHPIDGRLFGAQAIVLVLGYTVYIDPLLTGDWSGQETTFDRFLGAEPFSGGLPPSAPTALFLDPDTGVNEKWEFLSRLIRAPRLGSEELRGCVRV